MEPQPLIIECTGLTRLFKETRAVDSLDLAIRPGELFGLVGPDGAGKTTTLRLLAGLLDISGGMAKVAGEDLARRPEAVKPHIGYMAQQFSLYSQLSVVENLSFFAALYDLDRSQVEDRMERLLDFAGLTEFKDRRAVHLSGGMQKKLALACTLIHQPEILLLDEPTTGVDPISRREFWNILNELHLQGATILVSTPYMDEADRCSRVGLMHAGRMIVCDEPHRLREGIQGELVEIQPEDWRAARSLIAGLPGVLEVQTYGEGVQALVDSSRLRIPIIKKALRAQGLHFREVRKAPVRMETVFISLMAALES